MRVVDAQYRCGKAAELLRGLIRDVYYSSIREIYKTTDSDVSSDLLVLLQDMDFAPAA